ncbi:hypothetical protein [Microbacterium sp. Clip185]|uniref:hypothetical protein n=1 Tax=Microbacterium sp. Clip185 TaxID=3025663 RepID=UPI0023656826|nr:hypothetical protein [Microbacterium sp. Clip185]WDG16864.1 hypothetical protein PQV94_09415 [Microbacterium sp. Clip185]
MADIEVQIPSAVRTRVTRDIVILIVTVVVVAAVVVSAVLSGGVGGLIGIAAATVVVGAVKQIGAVLEIRYEQAIDSLQALVAPSKAGRLKGALKALGLAKDDSDEMKKMKDEAAALVEEFERRRVAVAEWSPAAGLVTWVLGLGAVLTAVLKLLNG